MGEISDLETEIKADIKALFDKLKAWGKQTTSTFALTQAKDAISNAAQAIDNHAEALLHPSDPVAVATAASAEVTSSTELPAKATDADDKVAETVVAKNDAGEQAPLAALHDS